MSRNERKTLEKLFSAIFLGETDEALSLTSLERDSRRAFTLVYIDSIGDAGFWHQRHEAATIGRALSKSRWFGFWWD